MTGLPPSAAGADRTSAERGPPGPEQRQTTAGPAAARAALGPAVQDELADLRRQESVLILLNLGVLGVLAGIHIGFASLVTTSVWLAVEMFTARFAMQVVELAWLHGRFGCPSVQHVRRYAQFSVWLNVAFACLASLVSGVPHSHYIVLMVLPTIAAAFRPGWAGLAAVVVVAVSVTFLYVGLYQAVVSQEERINECFEAATDTLTYLAVAIVVRLLVFQLRAEKQRLQRNLVELEQTRDRLVAEEKLAAVGRLSAAIAHEIRNPVGIIASAVATAQNAGFEPTARDEMHAIVVQESGRLKRLTDDFLSFARQAEPQRRPTSLRTTLEYLAALIRPAAAERQVVVTLEGALDREVLMDAAQIHQALFNLANNALEAAPAGGTITLAAELAADGGVELSVTNSGPPLTDAERARLFEPFFTTKPRGTGLGLAISRKIARAQGGELRLTHNEHNRVRFSLFLPIDPTTPLSRPEVIRGADSDCG